MVLPDSRGKSYLFNIMDTPGTVPSKAARGFTGDLTVQLVYLTHLFVEPSQVMSTSQMR